MFRKVKRRTDGRKNFDDSFDDSIRPSNSDSRIHKGKGLNYDLSVYPNRISFYQFPPFEEVTLEEFETWAIDRLKILLEIESCLSRGKNMRETESIIKPMLNKLLPLNPPSRESTSLYMERKKDHYSHFILRLAFCRSQELRARFIKSEAFLFKIRFNELSTSEQNEFVKTIDLPWDPISLEEKTEFEQQLLSTSYSSIKNILMSTIEYQRTKKLSEEEIKNYFIKEQFFKIPFEYVPELVSRRTSFLHKGFTYIPKFSQLTLISNEFSNKLEQELVSTMKALPTLDEDDRLLPVLNNLSQGYISNKYKDFANGDMDGSGASKDAINAENVLAPSNIKHMPLCASNLIDGLTAEHHLKYTARQQLSLFLKGIGLSADEALKFWQNQFTTGGSGTISVEKFNKEYRYNFRHNYGLEGGRINYKPWDCRNILSKPKPSKNEYHGCPYRDFHREKLSSRLMKLGLSDDRDLTDILDHSDKGDYQIACTKVFEVLHKKQMEVAIENRNTSIDQSTIVHPNQYYDRSKAFDKLLVKAE